MGSDTSERTDQNQVYSNANEQGDDNHGDVEDEEKSIDYEESDEEVEDDQYGDPYKDIALGD